MEGDPELLRLGPEAVLYAILDGVVDGYAPVVAGLQNDIDEIETEVFRGDPKVSRRIYELSREVIEFQRATSPLQGMLDGLMAGFEKYETDEELQRYLRDVADHATTVAERVDGFRQMLADILTVNATLVSQAQNEEIKNLTEASYDQNEEIKKVSAWAAILFAPTLIGTVYGMNFDHIPELGWVFGYPFSLALMAVVSLTLYAIFKRRGWLRRQRNGRRSGARSAAGRLEPLALVVLVLVLVLDEPVLPPTLLATASLAWSAFARPSRPPGPCSR